MNELDLGSQLLAAPAPSPEVTAAGRPRLAALAARAARTPRPNGLNKLPSCRVDLLGPDKELYASVIMGLVPTGLRLSS